MTPPTLRVVDSSVWCHAEMRVSGRTLTACRLPLDHEGSHVDGCTRWGFDDRPAKDARPVTCTRCEHPITTTPVVDPEDRSGRAYCSGDCRAASSEGAGEQWYPSGAAT